MTVPDPWRFLALELPAVTLVRAAIPEPGRYYDAQQAIVLRKGLRIEEERRYLWHEVTHALRRDSRCESWLGAKVEASVEREAARRAMPTEAMRAGLERSATWLDFVWHMKVPEEWVRFRVDIAHPAEKAMLREAARWEEIA